MKKVVYIIIIGVLLFFNSCSKYDEYEYIDYSKSVDIKTFTDNRDGQDYKYTTIGNQTWMIENLNYDAGSGSWAYDNNESYAKTYGRLYNWQTACEVCPDGWHLPSDQEWTILENSLNGKLKSGVFSALPGGYRNYDGNFNYMGDYAYFWCSTEYNSSTAWRRRLSCTTTDVYRNYSSKAYGFSVRCVRD
jgi:hypothetical protein